MIAERWIERRGIVVRSDGEALTVMRGSATTLPVHAAVTALDDGKLARWLAGFTWQPPSGRPSLRRVRLLAGGAGTWNEALERFLATWRWAERGIVQVAGRSVGANVGAEDPIGRKPKEFLS